jgi:hypothetical protein
MITIDAVLREGEPMPRLMNTMMLASVAMLAVAGCGGANATKPTDVSLSGTWSGTITDRIAGDAQFEMTVQQANSSLNGSWRLSPAGQQPVITGAINGIVVTPSNVDFSVIPTHGSWPDAADCVPEVHATVTGNQLTGTYVTRGDDCPVAVSGNMSLSKQ